MALFSLTTLMIVSATVIYDYQNQIKNLTYTLHAGIWQYK